MRDFLANLELSLEKEPRKVVIAYYNCLHRSILDSCSLLDYFYGFKTLTGLDIGFWRTRDLRLSPVRDDTRVRLH
jgi:hypothetical protein